MTRVHRLRGGFTYVELLVVLGLIALGIGFLVPTTCCRSRETANRVKCASNLRQIGQALMVYGNENGGHLPRTNYVPGTPPVWATGAQASNPFAPGGSEANDVSAVMFLLVRTQDLTAQVFLCPSSNAEIEIFSGSITSRSNFTDVKKFLSYSVANPYADAGVIAPDDRAWWTVNMSADYAVMADINPGTTGNNDDVLKPTVTSSSAQMKGGCSNNHDEDGQNVLYGDGHVEFQTSPFVGVKQDNIYTTKSGKVIASPSDASDSVLLPTDD